MGAEVPFVANRRLMVEEDRRCDIPACNCGGSHKVRREPFDWEVMDAALPLVRRMLASCGNDVGKAIRRAERRAYCEQHDAGDAAIAAVLRVLSETAK